MSNPASSSLTPAERRQQAIRAKVLRNSSNRLSHLLGTVGKEEIKANTGLVEEEEIHVPPLPSLSEGVLSSPPSVTRDDLPPPEPSPSPPPPASAIIPPPLSSTSEPQQATSNALLQSTGWILLGFLTRALLVLFPFLNAFFIFSITAFSLNILQLLNFSAPPPNNSSEVSFLRVACLIFLDSRTNDKVFAALRSLQHFLFAFSLFFFSFIVLDSCLLLMFWESFLALSLVKVLFLPSYHSTDFEVHRNWLAITHSLPLTQWYTDSCSQWTLDYPPFFAYFEWILSHFAYVFDPEMLRINNHGYASGSTLLFQRLSVIVSDVVLALGVKRCGGEYLGILCNAGLLLVDHIHFQYNGFLFGLLFLSMGSAMKGQHLLSAFWFAVLCNFKHIFAYTAPAYVVYLLGAYCFTGRRFEPLRFILLGSLVALICLISFGPFIYFGQLFIVLTRLFPFKRGLVHAYWAPNFWALYNSLDKMLSLILRRTSSGEASMTGGLVQEYHHSILPSVAPSATLFLTLLSMLPCLIKLWKSPRINRFIGAIVLCSWSSFLFGWHVHEKAILLIILPLALLAYNDTRYSKIYFFMSIVGHFSLFPLLYEPRETFLKVTIFLCHALYTQHSLHGEKNHLTTLEKAYLGGLGLVFIFDIILFRQIPFLTKYEFLPLLLYSLYSGLGVSYSWAQMYKTFMLS